jgi:RecA-family ATPase
VTPKCTILGSRHPSQSGQRSGSYTSGSTGWEAKERSRLVLRDPVYDDDDDDRKQRRKFQVPSNKRILTRAACNYALPGVEVELVFEGGAFSAVGINPATAPKRGQLRDLAADAKFLELLRKTRGQGRHVHDASNNPSRYAPNVFAADPEHGDFSKAEFKRAMDRAFSSKRIRIGGARHNEIVENQ